MNPCRRVAKAVEAAAQKPWLPLIKVLDLGSVLEELQKQLGLKVSILFLETYLEEKAEDAFASTNWLLTLGISKVVTRRLCVSLLDLRYQPEASLEAFLSLREDLKMEILRAISVGDPRFVYVLKPEFKVDGNHVWLESMYKLVK